MIKILKIAMIINITVSMFFIYTSYIQWDLFNGNNIAETKIISSSWNAYRINIVFHRYDNNAFSTMQTIFTYYNFPFWLFWILLAVNIFLVFYLTKEKAHEINRLND